MKRFAVISMILLLVVLLPAMAAAAAVGTVTQMTGRADVTGPDQVVRPLRVGDAVAQGDIVRTKSGAKVEITFEDGSVLRLAPVTRVEISEFVSTPTETRGLMSLLRGKIQSIVNKTGLFGMGRSNRYEVHTPTAVCGVRGTNFWVSYQGGVSNMVFKTGAGYTYSKSKPGEVQNVNAGQAAVVVSADQAPVVMPATDEEIQEHENDTDPTVTGGGDGGGGDGGEPQAFVGDDEGDGGGEDPLTTPEPEELPEVYVPPTVEGETETFTLFSSAIEFGDGLSATLGGEVGDTTNLGSATLTGDFFTSVESFGGTMDNGAAFQGTLGGQPGTWEGLFATIWQNGSQVGYLYSALSDPAYAEGGPTLNASGPVRREARAGTFTGGYLPEAMDDVGNLEEWTASIPLIPSYSGAPAEPSIMNGITVAVPTTPAGVRLLSVWQYSESPAYPDPGLFGAGSGSLVYGAAGWDTYYLGTIRYEDDGAGHAAEGGLAGTADDPTGFDMDRIFYMDPEVMGEIGRMYRVAYDPATGDYEAFGAGTATLDPLAVSGYWNTYGGDTSIYSPSLDQMDIYEEVWSFPVAEDYGIIGGIYAPWDGRADFTTIGTYDYYGEGWIGDGQYGSAFLWSSPVWAWANDSDGEYAGFTGGYWEPQDGAAYDLHSGVGAIVYLNGDRTAGGISLANNISGYFYDGVGGTGSGMFKADGTWVPDPGHTISGMDPEQASLDDTWIDGFVNGPSLANNESMATAWGQNVFIVDNEAPVPWGVYGLQFEMLYDTQSLEVGVPWKAAAMSRTDDMGFLAPWGNIGSGEEGYWLGDIDWTWGGDGKIGGSISGDYLSIGGAGLAAGEIGTFGGDVRGLWETGALGDYGGAIGQSIGVYEAKPLEGLAFFGYPEGLDDMPVASIFNYGPDPDQEYHDFVHQGALMGLIGLTSGDQPDHLEYLAIGEWVQDLYANPYGRYIFREPILDIDDLMGQVTPLAGDGGTIIGDGIPPEALRGYGAGILRPDAVTAARYLAEGFVVAIQEPEDPLGDYQLLSGDLAGGVYEYADGYGGGLWKGKGDLATVAMPAADSSQGLDWQTLNLAKTGGSALAVDTIEGETFGWLPAASNPDRPWGVWQVMLGAEDSSGAGSGWQLELEGQDSGDPSTGHQWIRVDRSGQKNYDSENGPVGELAGDVAGAWVNLGDAITGVLGGKLKGTFDPSNWQAVALGAWMDTKTFMEMALERGAAGQEALRALNIPAVQIGSATLTNSEPGDNLQVTMADVTFFARNTGAMPSIWASNGVSGSYGTVPSTGESVALSGTSPTANLNASFDVTQWNQNGNWSAAVNGGGTVATHDISFTGAAAGKDFASNPAADGTMFSGTAAGVAGPQE